MDHQMTSLVLVTYHDCYWTKKQVITVLKSVLMCQCEHTCNVCGWTGSHGSHGIGGEVQGQPAGAGSIIAPLWGSCRSNSITSLIWQASLPTDLSAWAHYSCINKARSWQECGFIPHILFLFHYNGFLCFSELSHLASSGRKSTLITPMLSSSHAWLWLSSRVFSGPFVSIKNPYKETELLH